MSKIISVVSGKGGCGKSLLTAVLGRAIAREGEKVLIIDLDIFVRGLTVLLNSFSKKSVSKNLLTVSDIFGIYSENSQQKEPKLIRDNLAIERFFECDVLPAVSNIADSLDYNDRDLSNQDFCNERIASLLEQVSSENYDYILLDNRAGMDSLVFASCYNSEIVLSIAEDDEVGKLTNLNVVNFIRFRKNVKNIFSIINKARRVKDYKELNRRISERSDFNIIGIIPFDIEILEDFGTDRFWNSVDETLYFKAVIDSWNRLSREQHLVEIKESKYHFPPKIFMNSNQGKYTLLERMIRLYSIIFVIVGISIYVYSKVTYEKLSNLDTISLISISLGIFALIFSTSNIKQFIFGKREENI